jgi:SNF2 family DNA or RNA helicase
MPSIAPSLSTSLSDMPELDLAVLRALALYRRDLGQIRLVDVLSSHIFKPQHPRATKLTMPMVKESLSRLHKKQLIERMVQGTYKLVASNEPAVLWELVQSGDLNSFKALRRELLQHEHSNWQHDELFYRREVFWAALIGDAEACNRWVRSLGGGQSKSQQPSLASLLLCDQDGKYLFENFQTDVQVALLQYEFALADKWLSGCILCYEYAVVHAREFKSFPLCLGLLCSQARLRADWQALESVHLLMLPQHELFDHAAIALMKGDFVLANQFYNEVIKLERGTTRKRKIFLPELDGILYALSAIGENTAASLKVAKSQVDDGVKEREDSAYLVLKPFVDSLVSGMPFESQPAYYAPRLPLAMGGVIEVMVLFWRESPFQKGLKEILMLELERLTSFGYHWVAAELDVLLVRIFKEPPTYPNWHEQQQLKPLIDIRAHEEPWKRALTALASLSKPTSTSVSAANLYRIAWLVESSEKYLDLEAREQKCSAKGVWNKGRIVSLKRLITEPETVVGLSEQDKRIIMCIDRNRNYYGSDYEINIEQALPLLINHPAVFWSAASDIRIDVIAGEITLQMNEKAGQIRLQLDPKISPDQSVMWKNITPTRLAVYVNTPEIKQIAGILGAGLSVPSEAKIQLVEVIKAIAPHITIHSNLPELSAHMATLDADTTLYAHLLPLKEGLRMQLLQRPLPGGSWYTPGRGPTNVVGEVAGETVQAVRNFKDEKKRLNKLIEACPSLALLDRIGSDQEWQLEHPEACLELLSELKAQPETLVQLVWPEGERMRLSGSRSLSQMRLSIRKQGEWFEADGDITLDDGRVFALRELLQMMSQTSGRFLRLGDNDYIALTDSFRRRLEELNAFAETNTKGRLRINPLAAPALAELAREVGDLEADDAWKDQVKKLDALADFTPKLPPTLQAELRDYQLEGYCWLARLAHWGVGACLADDMGLGKTVQALALLLDRALKGPALVVAPLSVAMNWLSEAQKFSPTLNMRSYHNNRDLTELGAFDVVVASYGMLQQDAELFAQQHWHTVVLDEAQAIKNTATKRSQAAMSLTADFKMIASGTPVENHLGELWNLFRFINPGLLGSKDRFAQRFSTPIERGDMPARAHLKKLIQPFILRRTKTQVLNELPSRTQITLQVELSDAERHLYEALRQQAVSNVENAGKAAPMQVLAEITKLRRFCCNPKLVLKDTEISASKLTVFAETLDELLDNKHKALVFSQFVDHLTIVRDYLDSKNISYQYLDGSVLAVERKKRVDAFQSGEGDVFLISLKAGGTGLNLTAADYVIHLDPWWNPAVEDQASDRAHRMGQLRPVTIYRLVVKDTIEEKIIGLHGKKRDLADSLLDGGEAAGRLDTAALLGLLKESI